MIERETAIIVLILFLTPILLGIPIQVALGRSIVESAVNSVAIGVGSLFAYMFIQSIDST
jgi:hypothetical protein